MILGVPKETYPGERRVALVPSGLPPLGRAGMEVLVEPGAGAAAGYPDPDYADRGARLAAGREEVFRGADVVLQVRGLGANRDAGRADLELLRAGQIVIGMLDPLSDPGAVKEIAAAGVAAFALELMPRITRAQGMDVLSSMATVAGYKAVLLAADRLPRLFPLMMTAAGTLAPARILIIGAGVAGLQAIATARRLGAVVEAYDVRPAVKEQVESLGARFVELPLAPADSEDEGGYARAQDESFYRRQREVMARVVSQSDVVITTAAVPGRRSPVLVTGDMVAAMRPGSVIVDLAAERGGNCELTKADRAVEAHGVTILGPTNLPSAAPYHASQMFSKNLSTFLLHICKEGAIALDGDDEILRETLVARGGEVVHPRIREMLGAVPVASGARGEG
ncbi:MAG: Re/Si-specific NAD(P)(+) transhydrogenase subunit alpha [Acidobacteriota bacterium]